MRLTRALLCVPKDGEGAGDERPRVCPVGPTFPSEDCLPVPPMLAKYWMTFFVFSVLPAPDSPLQVEKGSRQVKDKEGIGRREAKR